MKLSSASLGFPRMGPNRELKFALEKYWRGAIEEPALLEVAHSVERQSWELQRSNRIDKIPVGDYYLYDGVLTWTEYLGILPTRFRGMNAGNDRLFAMARGVDNAPALSLKKWLTSNYHYLVPEYDGQGIQPRFESFLEDVRRGMSELGKDCAVPVVVGPVTMAYLTKQATKNLQQSRLDLLNLLIPVYKDLLGKLHSLGVLEIQIHETALVYEDESLLPLFQTAYPAILQPNRGIDFNMVSYMEDVGSAHFQWLMKLPEIKIVSLDFTRGNNLALIEKYGFSSDKILGAGVLDARSVWSVRPKVIKPIIKRLMELVESMRIQPSSSLQYLPWDLSCEEDILKHPTGPVLAFATQKLAEIALVIRACSDPACLDSLETAWNMYSASVQSHSNETVGKRITALLPSDFERAEPYDIRRRKQLIGVPILPTTTIGSFPQTKIIRQLRSQRLQGKLTEAEYTAAIDQQIALVIGIQEGLGLDIFVHGEPERTDMVEYFAYQMEGILFTRNGWVQAFGSRCTRPPIFWSDIYRPSAMTVREFKVAQALTEKPVKGMLTGPVTILNWSFPRCDLSNKEQAMQIALALRDEIHDLESSGCKVIQVDEPALREAMPLRADLQQEYLDWAVDAFRLSTAKAASETQIQTHMCYCEFESCMDAIDRLDTDVNSIENARSDDATLKSFQKIGYKKGLGPGTYDIHSPVVPSVSCFEAKLKSFLQCMEINQLVVNPDCGLKTRTWPETIASLQNMVEATKRIRSEV